MQCHVRLNEGLGLIAEDVMVRDNSAYTCGKQVQEGN